MNQPKLRVILVDDEPNASQVLSKMLDQYFGQKVEQLGIASHLEEAVAMIDQHKPDLVFLDIQLRERSGFEVLEQVVYKAFNVIFVTAYDAYALQAFRTNAMDYLLKPVDPIEFKEGVERALKQHTAAPAMDYSALLTELQQAPKRIGLPGKHGHTLVDPAEILFARAKGSYTEVYTADGKHYLISKNIRSIEEQLGSSCFLRVNRSAIINLRHLSTFSRANGGSLTIANQHEFGIGSSNRQQILQRIEESMTML